MAVPITSNQVSTDSILDINGKQTYLGNSFILPTTGTSLANTAETPICVLKNASTNTKSMFVFNRRASTDLNLLTIRIYKNPTLNVPGSTTAPINLRLGSSTASISLCYLGASITSNGTLMDLSHVFTGGNAFAPLIIIDPGTSILFTAQQSAAGTSIAVIENAWYEI